MLRRKKDDFIFITWNSTIYVSYMNHLMPAEQILIFWCSINKCLKVSGLTGLPVLRLLNRIKDCIVTPAYTMYSTVGCTLMVVNNCFLFLWMDECNLWPWGVLYRQKAEWWRWRWWWWGEGPSVPAGHVDKLELMLFKTVRPSVPHIPCWGIQIPSQNTHHLPLIDHSYEHLSCLFIRMLPIRTKEKRRSRRGPADIPVCLWATSLPSCVSPLQHTHPFSPFLRPMQVYKYAYTLSFFIRPKYKLAVKNQAGVSIRECPPSPTAILNIESEMSWKVSVNAK